MAQEAVNTASNELIIDGLNALRALGVMATHLMF
jgi:hypothetical protein